MRELSIYVFHSDVNSVDQFLNKFCLEDFKSIYSFIWDTESPDILIVTDQLYSRGIYKKKSFRKLYNNSKLKVFFATEALYPDFNLFDYAIGWDPTIDFDRFCQLPPSFLYPAKLFINDTENRINTIEQAKEELKNKQGFCSFLYSNWRAHPMRDELFFALCKYKKVDSLGKHLNNVEKKGTGYIGHRKEGISIKSLYKFSISCENASHPGYTSEKLLTSFNAHSIPIYWGDPCVEEYFNPESFINVSRYSSLTELVNEIKKIDCDDDLWCKMVSAPWQTEEQVQKDHDRYSKYKSFWNNIFEHYNIARIPCGTMPSEYEYWFFHGSKSKCRHFFETILHKLKMKFL